MWIIKYILIPIVKVAMIMASIIFGVFTPIVFVFNTLRLKQEIKRIKDETNW
jgi:hypothetical protein